MAARTFTEIFKYKRDESDGYFRKASSRERGFSVYKTDDDKRLVFGWASVSVKVDGEQLEDRQKDMIDPEELEEAVYEYVLNFRDAGEEHIASMRKKGRLVESCVFTKEKQRAMGIPEGMLPVAWWIGFKIEDDEAWEKVKNGTYKMFSIEGRATREPVEKTGRNFEDFPGYWEWLEENLNATREDAEATEKFYGGKTHKTEKAAYPGYSKTFLEILKYNEKHDEKGKFATRDGNGLTGGGGSGNLQSSPKPEWSKEDAKKPFDYWELSGDKTGFPRRWKPTGFSHETTLNQHFSDHGASVGANSMSDYQQKAKNFMIMIQNYLQKRQVRE